ncbi:MAG: hypothetical protein RSE45_02180 [Bacilli bacterium]
MILINNYKKNKYIYIEVLIMLCKIFVFLMSIILTSVSLTFIILYAVLLNMNYSFFEYIKYIVTKPECICIIPGILLIIYLCKKKRRNIC